MLLYRFIDNFYQKKVHASGLVAFRMLYTLALLGEVLQMLYFRPLIFDKIPYVSPYEIDMRYSLVLWAVSIMFVFVGLFTRQAAIINYVCTLFFLGTITTYEYHMFYIYLGVNFLLIFCNTSQVGSLDSLIKKLKYSNTKFEYKPSPKVSELNYYALVFVGIAIVYFDSVFWKIPTELWRNGLGVWLPASIPHTTHIDTTFILNQKWLVMGASYMTLVFEAILIFVFFRKSWRFPMAVIGIILHTGIVVAFPIPWFGIGVIAIYLLMLPISWWGKTINFFKSKKPSITIYFDEECPLCNRTKLFFKHFDFFTKIEVKGVQGASSSVEQFKDISKEELLDNIYSINAKGKVLIGIRTYRYAFLRMPLLFPLGILLYIPGVFHLGQWVYGKVAKNRYVERCSESNCGYTPPNIPVDYDKIKLTQTFTLGKLQVWLATFAFVFICFMQLNSIYQSALIEIVRSRLGFLGSSIENKVMPVSMEIYNKGKVLFGFANHTVFLDHHFEGYDQIIALEAEYDEKKEWLPIIDKDGHPGIYNYSFCWAKWTFRTNSPLVNMKVLQNGIRDFSTFWAFKHGVPLDKVKFNVYLKKIDLPTEWEYDFLKKQKAKPWQKVGQAYWNGNAFVSEIPDIETL